MNDLLSYNQIFIERTANVGILPVETAINFGISGPMLRGSGLKWDLRKDDPYSIYNKFDFDIPVGQGLKGTVGDSWDRYYVQSVPPAWMMHFLLKVFPNQAGRTE